jgi:hypothetical protein
MGSSTWYMSSTVWAADIAKASSLLCVVSSRLNCLVALANLGGVAPFLGLIRFFIAKLGTAVGPRHCPYC